MACRAIGFSRSKEQHDKVLAIFIECEFCL
ncbi:MAG: hypothetical protein GYB40_14600 [Vibrionaceae bacterium]|nr:hypothetical protein [Vibrionaceae bacterium]